MESPEGPEVFERSEKRTKKFEEAMKISLNDELISSLLNIPEAVGDLSLKSLPGRTISPGGSTDSSTNPSTSKNYASNINPNRKILTTNIVSFDEIRNISHEHLLTEWENFLTDEEIKLINLISNDLRSFARKFPKEMFYELSPDELGNPETQAKIRLAFEQAGWTLRTISASLTVMTTRWQFILP